MPDRPSPTGANPVPAAALPGIPLGARTGVALGAPTGVPLSGLTGVALGAPTGVRPSGRSPVAGVAPVHTFAAAALAGVSLMAAAGVGSLFLDTASDAWVAIAAAGPASPADGILLVVALGGALLSMWLGLGISLSALAALPGALGQASSLVAAHIAPAAASKIVAVVLGTTLTAALPAGTAVANTGHFAPGPALFASSQMAFGGTAGAAPSARLQLVRAAAPAVDAAPSPSWFPDSPASVRRPAAPNRVAVHRGDTLWSIAAHQLGPNATSAEIDAEWHRWFAANRKVIGDDANRISPGQVLTPPETSPASS